MGCQLSVPEKEVIQIGKTERHLRTGFPNKNHVEVQKTNLLPVSNSSSPAGTMSLEADEEMSDHLPKLDQNGHLMPEEVVRRTSSSLSVWNIAVGNKGKGGKEL